MRALILLDETGKSWFDTVTIIKDEDGQWSQRYYDRQAKRKLASQFIKYWLGGRFQYFDDEFVDQHIKMLEANKWTFKTYQIEPLEEVKAESP